MNIITNTNMSEINLPVKYISQWDSTASLSNNDCGATASAMVLSYYGRETTSDEVFKLTGAGSGYITYTQLINAIKKLGYESKVFYNQTKQNVENFLRQGIIPVALFRYADLTSVQDKNFKGAHFSPIVGVRDDGYFVNDTNFWGNLRQDGDHHFYNNQEFNNAWKNVSLTQNLANSMLVIYPKTSEDPCLNLLKKYNVKTIDEFDKKLEEHIGLTWGNASKEGGGFLAGERRKNNTLNDQVKTLKQEKQKLTEEKSEINRQLSDKGVKIKELEDKLKDPQVGVDINKIKQEAKQEFEKEMQKVLNSNNYKLASFLISLLGKK